MFLHKEIKGEELLPGVYQGNVRFYRYKLKSGECFRPPIYEAKLVLLIFGKGKGYVVDGGQVYSISEPSVYVPDFDKSYYDIYAEEPMEWIMAVAEMNQWDWEIFYESHARLPMFRPVNAGVEYVKEGRKAEIRSLMLIWSMQLGRMMVGSVKLAETGFQEKGTPILCQWHYSVGESEFELQIGEKCGLSRAGDWNYIPAGTGYSIEARKGKKADYIWIAHFVREKDFMVKPDP